MTTITTWYSRYSVVIEVLHQVVWTFSGKTRCTHVTTKTKQPSLALSDHWPTCCGSISLTSLTVESSMFVKMTWCFRFTNFTVLFSVIKLWDMYSLQNSYRHCLYSSQHLVVSCTGHTIQNSGNVITNKFSWCDPQTQATSLTWKTLQC